MLKSVQIVRIGVAVTAISLIMAHVAGFPHELTSFWMGMGCSLSIIGEGKRFAEIRSV